jgi:hypothetical protein
VFILSLLKAGGERPSSGPASLNSFVHWVSEKLRAEL